MNQNAYTSSEIIIQIEANNYSRVGGALSSVCKAAANTLPIAVLPGPRYNHMRGIKSPPVYEEAWRKI